MGEAVEEEAKSEGAPEEKKEGEKKEEEAGEKKAEEEEEKPPSPPPPVILLVELHCMGCAKKIQRCIMKYRGVEGVEMDMAKNQVTIKGVVNPQDLCSRIQKRTMREAKVLSPAPPPEGEQQGADSQVVASQVGGITTVELNVNMHCEACAQQLRRKILKMRGVQTAETELTSGKVTVTGTMDADRLVEYVYRRTRKQAKIVPQPPPPPPVEEEKKQEEENKPPAEEKKEDGPKEGEKKEGEESKEGAEKADGGEKLAAEGGGGKEETPADGGDGKGGGDGEKKGGEGGAPSATPEEFPFVEDDLKKMMYHWAPIYVVERLPPPPQLFSDENPNACCIS